MTPPASLPTLLANRLTRAQYTAILGQLYHFSRHAQRHLLMAATNTDNPRLAVWLRKHAREEHGHHRWAVADLKDLGEPIPPANLATENLLDQITIAACGPRPHRILGLSLIVEHLSPTLNLATFLPANIGAAQRYLANHVLVDQSHAAEVDREVAALSPDERADVTQAAGEFKRLFEAFVLAAAGGGA